MQIFKKIILTFLIFFLMIFLVSIVVIDPYLNSEFNNYQDSYERKEYEGKIDCVFIGASQGWCSFYPSMFDEKEGTFSYNLSCSMMNLDARKFMLEKELQRNPVNTVVIEISQGTLLRDQHSDYGDGDSLTIERLDNNYERMQYMLAYVQYDNYLNIYSRLLKRGIIYWGSIITGSNYSNVDYLNRNVKKKSGVDVSLTTEEILNNYKANKVSFDYLEKNMDKLDSLIELCLDNNVEVILVVVPVSDAFIWQCEDMDIVSCRLKEYAQEKSIQFYDFNLMKDKSDIFSDEESFYDQGHLSEIGGEAFTKAFIKIYDMRNANIDISDYFYEDYEEMISHMNYMRVFESY